MSRDEPEYQLPGWQTAVDDLVRDGALLQSADGESWHAARKQPHRRVNLRSIGASWTLYDRNARTPIGTVSGGQVYGECHDGAIYLHRGRQYLIAGRDAAKGHIHAEAVEVPYYTRTKTDKGNGNPGHPALASDAGLSGQIGAPQGALSGGGLREDSRARRRPAQRAPAGIAGRGSGDHRLLAGTGAAIPAGPETTRFSLHGIDPRHRARHEVPVPAPGVEQPHRCRRHLLPAAPAVRQGRHLRVRLLSRRHRPGREGLSRCSTGCWT